MGMENFKAGRELDALVAEKVMGWKLLKQMTIPPKAVAGFPPGIEDDGKADFHEIPHYSTDLSAAWEVVGKLSGYCGDSFTLRSPNEQTPKWWACFERKWPGKQYDHGPDGHFGNLEYDPWFGAETAPLAICAAALKAVGLQMNKSPEWMIMLGGDGLVYRPSLLRCLTCGGEGNDSPDYWTCLSCGHKVMKAVGAL